MEQNSQSFCIVLSLNESQMFSLARILCFASAVHPSVLIDHYYIACNSKKFFKREKN